MGGHPSTWYCSSPGTSTAFEALGDGKPRQGVGSNDLVARPTGTWTTGGLMVEVVDYQSTKVSGGTLVTNPINTLRFDWNLPTGRDITKVLIN